jgi:hypothetical protein
LRKKNSSVRKKKLLSWAGINIYQNGDKTKPPSRLPTTFKKANEKGDTYMQKTCIEVSSLYVMPYGL